MGRVSHFDMSADNPERAMEFYKAVFGWWFEKWEGPFDYWLVMTGEPSAPGIDGGLARRTASNASITNFIDVPNLEECIGKIVSCGGKILQEKQTIPGVGYIALFQDTEGNIFGIIQMDINAI